jgi:hypothetical protein
MILLKTNSILCYEEQNGVLCAAAGSLAAERSDKTIFAPNDI